MSNVTVSLESIKEALTECIQKYINIEKNPKINGLEYQQETHYVRGQINILTQLINMSWQDKEKSYYKFINELIEHLNLNIQDRLN